MCCRCCTTLKVAGTWGAGIHVSIGLLLLIGHFVIDEALGDLLIPYLVYISLLVPIGMIILLAVQKEIEILLRIITWFFVLTQIFGFGIRLLVPAQKSSWTIVQRIVTLFIAILSTAIYSTILCLFAKKLKKARRAAEAAKAEAEFQLQQEGEELVENVGEAREIPS